MAVIRFLRSSLLEVRLTLSMELLARILRRLMRLADDNIIVEDRVLRLRNICRLPLLQRLPAIVLQFLLIWLQFGK